MYSMTKIQGCLALVLAAIILFVNDVSLAAAQTQTSTTSTTTSRSNTDDYLILAADTVVGPENQQVESTTSLNYYCTFRNLWTSGM
mgnify:CR=1 FL=1